MARRIIGDKETEVLHSGLQLLELIGQTQRRRVLAYWCARAESLPLKDAKGKVLQEHPEESEPPMIQFIKSHKAAEDGKAAEEGGEPAPLQ